MRTVAIGAWLAASILVVLYGGDHIPHCSVPIGGTSLSCVSATGVFPTRATLLMSVAIWLGAGSLIALTLVRPSRRGLLLTATLSVLAAPLGALAYALTRPLTLEGPRIVLPGQPPIDYVVLDWPFDWRMASGSALLASATVLAASVVALWFQEQRRQFDSTDAL